MGTLLDDSIADPSWPESGVALNEIPFVAILFGYLFWLSFRAILSGDPRWSPIREKETHEIGAPIN